VLELPENSHAAVAAVIVVEVVDTEPLGGKIPNNGRILATYQLSASCAG
jgi:hypothetical protein